MVLMDRRNVSGKIDDRDVRSYRKPEQPGVPAGTADDEFGNLVMIEAPRKDKIVHPLRRPLAIRLLG